MAEQASEKTTLSRSTPLAAVAKPGVYGRAGEAGPGVSFRERRDFAIASIVARPGATEALAQGLKSGLGAELPAANGSTHAGEIHLLFAGLDRWNAVAEGLRGGELLSRLQSAVGESGAVADQSHGLCVIEMSGPRVMDVLAKGSVVDLHPEAFPVGRAVATGANHLAIHLWHAGENRVLVTVLRSFARDLFEFLTTMSLEFGYRVEPGA